MAYVKTGKGSVVGAKTRRVYTKIGEIIPEEDLGSAVDRLVKSGMIRNTEKPAEAKDEEPEAGEGDVEDKVSDILTHVTKAPAKPDVQVSSSWAEDPAKLKGLSIAELNARVLKIDPTIEPFDTVEEAVAFMSRDFNKPDVRKRPKK